MFGSHFNSSANRGGTGVNAALDDNGKTALHFAVEAQNFAEVEKLLRIGAKPNAQANNGETPLFIAARTQNIAIVEKLLERGATFKIKDDNGVSVLDAAIEGGCDVRFIEKLKNLGATVDIPATDERTPLHNAIEKGAAPDILDYLVSEGISVNAKDQAGRTALHYAVEKNDHKAMLQLISLGADTVVRDNYLETPLHAAAKKGDVKAVDILLNQSKVRETINDFKTYQEGYTPLMTAAAGNHAAIVEKIARVGADMNLTDNQNRHSLFIAVESGNLEAVRVLLALGSDVAKGPQSTSNKSSMMHWINTNNFATILVLLQQAGAAIDIQDGSGYTALHKACDDLNRDKIKALLSLGANPNIPNEFGKRPIDIVLDHYAFDNSNGEEIMGMLLAHKADCTIAKSPDIKVAPLHVAASQGRTGTVKILLAHKAIIDAPERHDSAMTALQLAAQFGHLGAFKLLHAAGADIAKRDNQARTALHYAVMGGNDDVTDIAIAQPKIDINAKDNEGFTALHFAARLERLPAAEKLLARGAHPSLYDMGGMTPLHHAAASNSGSIVTLFMDNLMPKLDINMPTRDEGMTALHIAVRDNHQMLVGKLLELGADPARAAKNALLPLHYAILNDHQSLAEVLLTGLKRQKQPLDKFQDKNGWTLLHYAATRETPQMASLLIAGGCSPAAKAADTGDTPLHIAARAGRIEVVEYLVESKDAGLAVSNKDGDTPLAVALRLGRDDIALYLMQKMVEQKKLEEKPSALLEFKQSGKGPKP